MKSKAKYQVTMHLPIKRLHKLRAYNVISLILVQDTLVRGRLCQDSKYVIIIS